MGIGTVGTLFLIISKKFEDFNIKPALTEQFTKLQKF